MTAQIQDHIHIFALPTSVYNYPTHDAARKYAITMTGVEERPVTPMSWRRGFTGATIVTRMRLNGEVVSFRDKTITMLLPRADKEALVALTGQDCYLVGIEHDDAGTNLRVDDNGNVQGYPCLVAVDRAIHVDPAMSYWIVTVQITEDSI